MRWTMIGAAGLLAAFVTMTSPAHAATLLVQDKIFGYLTYMGALGEENAVTATMDWDARTLVLTDPGARSITAATRADNAAAEHCVFEPRRVTCRFERPAWPAYFAVPLVNLELRDGNDTAWSNTWGIVAGGLGDDRLTKSGESAVHSSWLVGGPGADVLNGGPGEDSLIGGPGPDVIDGGGNLDDVWWQASVRMSPPVETDGAPATARNFLPERIEQREDVPAGGVKVTLDGMANDGHLLGLEGDNVLNVEKVWGTLSADVLVAGPGGGGWFDGRDGDDLFIARDGHSMHAEGGAGNDTFDLRDFGVDLETDPYAAWDSYTCDEGLDTVRADPFDRLSAGYDPAECEWVTVEEE